MASSTQDRIPFGSMPQPAASAAFVWRRRWETYGCRELLGLQFVPHRLRGYLRAAVFLERQVGEFFEARGLVVCSLNVDDRRRASRRRDVFVCMWYSWLCSQNAKIEVVRWMTQNMATAPIE